MFTHVSKNKKHLFNLPDGSTLKIAPPGTRGPQSNWYMSFDTPSVWRAAGGRKGRQYRVNLWSSSTNLYVIAADYDVLPPGFSDFDALFTYLGAIFSKSEAIVARSVSGKVKIFFLVETPSEIDMDAEIAIETMAKIFSFDSDLFNCVDRSKAGLSISYLNQGVLRPLVEGLPHLHAISVVLPEGVGGFNTSTTDRKQLKKPLRSYQGSLEIIPDFKGSGAKENFLRILLESKQLLCPNGFGISTLKISKQIGVCQQLVSRLRNEFVGMKWLVPLDEGKFFPGKMAKRFMASSVLASALKKVHPMNKDVVIPDSIPDHCWNDQLGRLVGRLFRNHSLEEVLLKIGTIEGSRIGTRMRQARNWYEWYSRRSVAASSRAVVS